MGGSERTANAVRNAVVGVVCQLTLLATSFAARTAFIRALGADYLGLSSLFTNVLSLLSLAELGFGSAVTYSLYRPIAEGDTPRLRGLVRYLGRIYRVVGLTVALLGLALAPFVHNLVRLEEEVPQLTGYYLLYVADCACSYLFAYKAAVLEADQKHYVTRLARALVQNAVNIARVVLMARTRSYLGWILIQLAGTFAANLAVRWAAVRRYPYLRGRGGELDAAAKGELFANARALLIYKIGSVALNQTDNLLISVLIGTAAVGLYSNYFLLFGTVVTFADLLFSSLGAVYGNLYATEGRARMREGYDMIAFASFAVYGFGAVCLFCLQSDFVRLWLGQNYVLDEGTVFAICLNVFVTGMRTPSGAARNATGLFRETRYVFAATALLNLGLSVLLGKVWGLAGILGATALSRLLTQAWYEPYVFSRKVLREPYRRLLAWQARYGAAFLGACGVVHWVKRFARVETVGAFVLETLLCAAAVAALWTLLFGRTEVCRRTLAQLRPIARRLLKKPL